MNQEKERKGIPTEKGEVLLSFFADGMVIYLNDSDDSKRKLLDLIHTLAKVAYKITFLYSNNKLTKKNIFVAVWKITTLAQNGVY